MLFVKAKLVGKPFQMAKITYQYEHTKVLHKFKKAKETLSPFKKSRMIKDIRIEVITIIYFPHDHNGFHNHILSCL